MHVFWDGSVSVSTGAVEMSQGVNAKMLQVAATTFGISNDKIKLETTNTTRVANTSPSAARSTGDLNGKALLDACTQILERLKQLARRMHNEADDTTVTIHNETIFINGVQKEITWQQLVRKAYESRISLSAKGHYATPKIHFDKTIEKGYPFAYHVYGTARTIVTLDCLRGIYEFDAVHAVHDFGASIRRNCAGHRLDDDGRSGVQRK